MAKSKATVPYSFVLDLLDRADPVIKPMFGCHAIYVGIKIVLIVRKKGVDNDDGVWLATHTEHHPSLQEEFPSMRSIELFGTPPTAWQIIPEEADDFESSVIKACEMILRGDERIGRIPKPKAPKKKKTKA